VDLILEGRVGLVINTPFGREPRTDGYFIRTAAARTGVPCITTVPGILAAVQGIEALRRRRPEPRPLQEYHAEDRLVVVGEPAGPVPREDAAGRIGTSAVRTIEETA